MTGICQMLKGPSLLWTKCPLASIQPRAIGGDMAGSRATRVSVSALCMAHYLNDSARLGWAMRKAVEEDYDGTVAFFASGSLSHRFAQNGLAPQFAHRIWSPFLETLDRRVVELWQQGRWQEGGGQHPGSPTQ